jgi:predicted amidohydrolase
MTEPKIRVSAVQFGVGTEVAENLETCLRMIDQAAADHPQFIVLPEFCNHCAIYESLEYANQVALDLKGEFLTAIAAKAKEINSYIKINVTLKREGDKPTVSNLLYSPQGKLAGRADKQVLMGNENNFCSRAKTAGDIVKTPFGLVGMYACADGLLMETTRLLALRGARLLLNSLNSFAEDEASLHIPVRAAENKVFVVASCKVDYLVPKEIIADFAEKMKIKPEDLQGAGESQIVAPNGEVLAKAPKSGEAVVFADIDLTQANPEAALRHRRPELYKPIARKPKERNYRAGAEAIKAAICQNYGVLRNVDANLIVFPELIFFTNGVVSNLERAVQVSTEMVKLLKGFVSGTNKFVVTSIVERTEEGIAHVGIVVNRDGIIFRQPMLHFSGRQPWVTSFGNEIQTVELPFGKLALIVGNDLIYPETFRLAAYQNAEIVACPFAVQERWETEFGLLERAAENRFSIVAATRPNHELGEFGNSLIATVSEDFTLWTQWKNRPFDGKINYPIVRRAKATDEVFSDLIYPANAGNRLVSQQTDVVDGRAYWLLKPLAK